MINPFNIIEAVEQEYYLRPGSLIKPNRHPRTSEARSIAMYLMRKICNLSYPEIGDYFERDHSTVIHNYKKVALFSQNPYKKDRCNVIIKLTSQILNQEQST